MKRCFFVILLICLFVTTLLVGCKESNGVEDFVPEYKEFSVMTFNIRTYNWEEDTPNLWENRKERLFATIYEHSPDIIGFQEVRDFGYQFDNLKDSLTDYGWCGHSNYFGSDAALTVLGAETNAVFYKKERFTLESWETKWLSDTPDVLSAGWDEGSTYRTYTKAILKDKLSGQVISFLNTHLDPGKPITMEKVSKNYSKMAKEYAKPFIITGDFNYPEGSSHYEHITSGVLKDSKYLATQSDTGGTYHSFTGNPSGDKPIDFVFVTPSFFKVHSYNIIRDHSAEGLYPSDHFPILVTLELLP